MTELFQFSFFTQALLMAVILAPLFGLISFFVVLRRMSFLGAGIAHTAFGGVALGVFLGISPFFTSMVFCVLAAVVIGRLARNAHVSHDTLIGIVFAFSMALGGVLIALRKAYTFDLSGYLFGNILAVTGQDIIMAVAVSLIFYVFTGLMMHRLLYVAFEVSAAEVSGIPTVWLETGLLACLALIIVVSIKLVGIILVSALVVLPASFGLLLTRKYRKVIYISIIYTLLILLTGMAVSYGLDLPTGSTIVVLGSLIYFMTFLLRQLFFKIQ